MISAECPLIVPVYSTSLLTTSPPSIHPFTHPRNLNIMPPPPSVYQGLGEWINLLMLRKWGSLDYFKYLLISGCSEHDKLVRNLRTSRQGFGWPGTPTYPLEKDAEIPGDVVVFLLYMIPFVSLLTESQMCVGIYLLNTTIQGRD